jgi:hypothetical protein
MVATACATRLRGGAFCGRAFSGCFFADVDMLGPREFEVMRKSFERMDLTLKNKRGLQLECSWYRQTQPQQPTPCIVYLHGNSGCRCDADDALLTMLPYGVSGERVCVFACRVLTRAVFTFDFSGSGQSGGDYVSLGVFEKDDVATVVEFLRTQTDFVSTIGLWGRSSKYPPSRRMCDADVLAVGGEQFCCF